LDSLAKNCIGGTETFLQILEAHWSRRSSPSSPLLYGELPEAWQRLPDSWSDLSEVEKASALRFVGISHSHEATRIALDNTTSGQHDLSDSLWKCLCRALEETNLKESVLSTLPTCERGQHLCGQFWSIDKLLIQKVCGSGLNGQVLLVADKEQPDKLAAMKVECYVDDDAFVKNFCRPAAPS
jgi:uncharacterized circularly permuted ATP-grasp superfamily protein